MISGIVLAAGTATRMGRLKQLLPLDGKPLLQHVVDLVAAGPIDHFSVIVGNAEEEVRAAIRLPEGGRWIVNPAYASGQASSLRVGLDSLGPDARAAVIFLADEPRVPLHAVRDVLAAYRETGGRVVRARYRSRPGHPVLLDRSVWNELRSRRGDRGAGPVLARYPEWVVDVEIDHDSPLAVDTPEDYRRLTGDPLP